MFGHLMATSRILFEKLLFPSNNFKILSMEIGITETISHFSFLEISFVNDGCGFIRGPGNDTDMTILNLGVNFAVQEIHKHL